MRCDGCGVRSEDERFFRAYYHRVSAPPKRFCPACVEERERRAERLGLAVAAVMLGVGLLSSLFVPNPEARALSRLALWVAGASLLSVVAHELGHAVAGWLVGLRVHTISFGGGPVLRRFSFGRTELELCSLPTCGFVRTSLPMGSMPRLQGALCAAGGPLVNAGLLALSVWRLPSFASTLADISPWHALAAVNGVILVMNLIPYSFADGDVGESGARQPNDGLSILSHLISRRESVIAIAGVALDQEVRSRLEEGERDAAARVVEVAARRYPEDPHVAVVEARVAAASGRRDDATTRLRALITASATPPVARRLARALLAELLLSGTSRREQLEADRVAEAALNDDPGSVELRVLRGRTLLATGWVERAREMLQSAQVIADRDAQRQVIAGYLAKATAAAGDSDSKSRGSKSRDQAGPST